MDMSRERREIVYSIIIIITIPLLFVFNTVLMTNRVSSDSNRNVRRNADQVNSVIAESLRPYIETKNYTAVTKQIEAIKKQQPSIGGIFVATRSGDGYALAARASDAPTSLSQNDRLQLSILFDRGRSIARRIDAEDSNGSKVKGWSVITPLLNSQNHVEAAVSTNVLTSDTEELIYNTLTTSFLVTGASVLVIVLLLLHHFRFVGYADLLRRQKEVNQTMSDFLGVATHELKAPMSIIKGYISNVLDGLYGEVSDELKDPLTTAISQTDRLNNLVQDLLNVSRIDQGRISIELQPVDIKATIATLTENYSEPSKSKGIELKYDSSAAATVYADPGRVQEIITNLIDNAVKYTASGSVTVSHRLQKNMLVTSVVDTGHGMTSEESSRLFQRFYRVRNDETKGIPGTGLGLWIIKQYAEKMNGKIAVSSIVGVGTEFTVELPIAKS